MRDRIVFGVGACLLHRLPFGAVELAGLVENRVADAELADVVQQGGALEPAPPFGRNPISSAIMSVNSVTRSLWPLV